MTEPQWAIDEIKEIQSNGIDWFGNPLVVDGDMGPKTRFWIGLLSLSEQRRNILKIALNYHYENVSEDKNNSIANDGTFVDTILKPVGLRYQPWCLAFVSHCYKTAGVKLPKYFTAAWQILGEAEKNGWLVETPLPGDIEIYLYRTRTPKDKTPPGHGRIVSSYDEKTKETAGVDGNVGDAVKVGKRRHRDERYFIRLPGLGGEQHKDLAFPTNMMYIDNLADR